MYNITLQKLFAQTSSIDELLEQLKEMQSRNVRFLSGPYYTSIDIDFIISIINKMKYDHSKEEIYKSIVYIETGH